MQYMKPIPIKGEVITTLGITISPDKKYSASIVKTWPSKKLVIADNNKTYLSNTKPEHFQYKFSHSTEIHAMDFNSNSDKLYCLTKKNQYSQICQFNLAENSETPVDKQWGKQQAIPLPFAARCFSMDDLNNKLTIIGFEKQEIINNTIDTKSSLITSKNMPNTIADITRISFDAKNMLIYAFLQNKALIIYSEENNTWTIKHSIDNCLDLPSCYSNDGNTLVFKNSSKLQIRSLLPEHNGKIVKEIDLNENNKYKKIAIKDICINSRADKITYFTLADAKNYGRTLFYNRLEQVGSTWLCTESMSFNLCANNSLANPYISYSLSSYIDQTHTIILVNYNRIGFFYNATIAELKIADREKLRSLNRRIIEQNRYQYEYARREAANQLANRSSNSGFYSSLASAISSGPYSSCDNGSGCCD